MIIPDVNLLLYAELDAFGVHGAARRWWEGALTGDRQVGLAPAVVFGFLRLATSRRVFDPPLAVGAACSKVRAWVERAPVVLLHPGPRHLELAFGLLESAGTGGNLTTDAQIGP